MRRLGDLVKTSTGVPRPRISNCPPIGRVRAGPAQTIIARPRGMRRTTHAGAVTTPKERVNIRAAAGVNVFQTPAYVETINKL